MAAKEVHGFQKSACLHLQIKMGSIGWGLGGWKELFQEKGEPPRSPLPQEFRLIDQLLSFFPLDQKQNTCLNLRLL
jgi:hypothetical protein